MNAQFEVFRTGTHTDSGGTAREYTEADLDRMAERYNNSAHEAPLVVGHPRSAAPAYGWVDKLIRAGDRLTASVKQIVPEFAELVRKGLYRKVSIALSPDGLLRHIGFLGAEAPAVKGLADIQFTEGSADDVQEYEQEESISADDFANLPDTITREEFGGLLNAIREQQDAIRELMKTKSKNGKQSSPSPDYVREAEAFIAFLEDAAADGKITPAQKQLASEFVGGAEGDEADREFSETMREGVRFLRNFVDLNTPPPPMKSRGPRAFSTREKSDFETVCGFIAGAMNRFNKQ